MSETDFGALSRRRVLTGAAALAGGVVLGTAASASGAPGYDQRQRFLRLVPGGNGTIYAIQADGSLFWYRHVDWATGGSGWAAGAGLRIGAGFHQFATVLAGADGQLYGIRPDGTIRWYRYVVTDPGTGGGHWVRGDGPVIGEGFQRFPRMFGGWDGVLYGVDDDGILWWYRYLAGDGTRGSAAWARGAAGAAIGSGWKDYPRLFADPNGVIYGVRQGGTLHWWRYLAGNGDPGPWASGSGLQINDKWDDGYARELISCGSGTLYTVAVDSAPEPGMDHRLVWYRITNSETIDRDGSAHFVNGGTVVGEGFTVERTAALQGYPARMSTKTGQSLGFSVSSTFATVTARAVRLAPGPRAETGQAITVPGRLQLLPADFRSGGCDWATDLTLPVAADWRSGLYSLRLTVAEGARHDVLFVVRPASPSRQLAFLVPTNTYNAYNNWGGHSQYTMGEDGRRRTVTWYRPGFGSEADPPARISHTLHSDLMLLNWMTGNGFDYDVYSDNDLDADSSWLPRYRALVLGSHPEYWSERMRDRLLAFLAAGGRVVYPGGNGLYERVESTTDSSAIVFRKPTGERDTYAGLGRPESDVLGVALGPAYMDFHPYRVVADHPLLTGTGLTPDAVFGTTGYNGGASGWEVDVIPAGGAGRVQRIAKGTNPAGGADMVVRPHGTNGGWVFSAGSIAFAGALADPVVSRILRNAVESALA